MIKPIFSHPLFIKEDLEVEIKTRRTQLKEECNNPSISKTIMEEEMEFLKNRILTKQAFITGLENSIKSIEKANESINSFLAEFKEHFKNTFKDFCQQFFFYLLQQNEKNRNELILIPILHLLRHEKETKEDTQIPYKDIKISTNAMLSFFSSMTKTILFTKSYVRFIPYNNLSKTNDEFKNYMPMILEKVNTHILNRNLSAICFEDLLDFYYGIYTMFKDNKRYKNCKYFNTIFKKQRKLVIEGSVLYTFPSESTRNNVESECILSDTESSVNSFNLFFRDNYNYT